jgi:hypothetical protein
MKMENGLLVAVDDMCSGGWEWELSVEENRDRMEAREQAICDRRQERYEKVMVERRLERERLERERRKKHYEYGKMLRKRMERSVELDRKRRESPVSPSNIDEINLTAYVMHFTGYRVPEGSVPYSGIFDDFDDLYNLDDSLYSGWKPRRWKKA